MTCFSLLLNTKIYYDKLCYSKIEICGVSDNVGLVEGEINTFLHENSTVEDFCHMDVTKVKYIMKYMTDMLSTSRDGKQTFAPSFTDSKPGHITF